jgi:DNA repair protein RecN (Recombination protein N)
MGEARGGRRSLIVHLRIRDLIVVKEASLELASGLNVLTGSTGSGKSVLLAALSLLAGERARADWIRSGAERASVEALLEFDDARSAVFAEEGFHLEEGQLSLRREIRQEGKGRAFIDGTPASVAELRRLGALIFERQDQHEQIRLLDSSYQLGFLDSSGGLEPLRSKYQVKLEEHRLLRKERSDKALRLERLLKEEEYLRFQLEEIEGIDPQPGEIDELSDRERRLRNASKIIQQTEKALELVDESPEAIRSQLIKLDKTLEKLKSLGIELDDAGLEATLLNLEELAESLRARNQDLSSEALQGENISERLNKLHTLERKHGRKLDELLLWVDEIRNDLDEMDSLKNELSALEKEEKSSAIELGIRATKLSEARKGSASKLGPAWQDRLSSLGLNAATLRVEVTPREDNEGWIELDNRKYAAGSQGMDAVRVIVRTNPDSREGTLREIPSGGELSRIALACRLLPGSQDGPPVLVLDEVDAGLGADIAPVLATELLNLAKSKQLLLVTHQPVLAAAAGRQFNVDKRVSAGETQVEVQRLEAGERLAEIIRMLGGESEDRQVREHAEFLLARAGSSTS